MVEHVAIVGSRQGADLEHVRAFVRALHAAQPDTIVVSGGADGVDSTAERAWLDLGGNVISFRPKKISDEEWAIEAWHLAGGNGGGVWPLVNEPTWANFASAALYRDMLIAERSQRVVVFYRKGLSRGAAWTATCARNEGREVYEFEAA